MGKASRRKKESRRSQIESKLINSDIETLNNNIAFNFLKMNSSSSDELGVP